MKSFGKLSRTATLLEPLRRKKREVQRKDKQKKFLATSLRSLRLCVFNLIAFSANTYEAGNGGNSETRVAFFKEGTRSFFGVAAGEEQAKGSQRCPERPLA
jgi:hypothetical protein